MSRARKPRRRSSRRPPAGPVVLQYKVVELSTVDEGSLEYAVNHWVQQGWSLENVQFAMRESSKRPAMAFVFFTRAGAVEVQAGSAGRRARPGARTPGGGSRLWPRKERTSMSRLRAPFGGPNLQLVPEDGVPESPYPRCSLLLRGMARLADVGVAWVLALAAGRAGLVVALLYLLLADGIFHGQSVGKRIFGVKVVFLPTRTDARFRDSTLRNAPLALIVLLRMMPEPLGLRGRAGRAGGHRRGRGLEGDPRSAGPQAREMSGRRPRWWTGRSSRARRRWPARPGRPAWDRSAG